MSGHIFISYASADRDYADRLIAFLEAQHFACWISYRDVAIGENYQESITRALRAAKALIVIFTGRANQSVEIQKELSLASRYRLVVIPLRMEQVEPSDALAYELTTHQWVDMFRSWTGGCERLLAQLGEVIQPDGEPAEAALSAPPPSRALTTSIAAATAPQSGSVFVPPRQRRDRAQAREIRRRAAASRPLTPLGVSGGKPAHDGAKPARAGLGREAAIIGWIKFFAVGLAFALLLLNSLEEGVPSILELFFWAILIVGCVRLLGAILRAMLGGAPPERA